MTVISGHLRGLGWLRARTPCCPERVRDNVMGYPRQGGASADFLVEEPCARKMVVSWKYAICIRVRTNDRYRSECIVLFNL